MKLNYINIITNNSVSVKNELFNLFIERKYIIENLNFSLDGEGNNHILVWLKLKEDEEISKIISKIINIVDIIDVKDMSDVKKQIKYIFNVNYNCKKTLKRISREPDKIVETDKELIYVFILKRKERETFISELSNLKLPYLERVIWLT